MKPERMIVHCFPGFLGLEEDWNFLSELIREVSDHRVDWKTTLVDPREGEGWTEWATRWMLENPWKPGSHEILLGYSLGGRAACHLAVLDPARFRALISISANPGILEESERAQRLAGDEAWAKRFADDPWQDVLESWNSQPVFGSTGIPERLQVRSMKESPLLRERCARQLRQLSLARQIDLTPALLKLKMPQVWMTGQKDSRYTEIARRFCISRRSHHQVIEGAGHRWPWELHATKASAQILRALEFLLEEEPE